MLEHILKVRVYYSDVDALGIVYHANYLNYLERARTESLRELGYDLPTLKEKYQLQIAICNLSMKFTNPARIDDILYIKSTVTKVQRLSFYYNQVIHINDEQGPLACSAELKLVGVDLNLKPTVLPEAVRMELANGSR